METSYARWILNSIYFFRGEKVWKILNDIYANQWLDKTSLLELQWSKLRKILFFAYENIPYYRKKWQEFNIHPYDITSIGEFENIPIITKDILRNNNTLFYSNYLKTRVSFRKTSGSTGTPLKIKKDRQTTAYMDAIMYRSYTWYKINPGDKQLKIWGGEINSFDRLKINIKDYLLNRIRLSAFYLDRDNFLKILKRIKSFRPAFIYGYAQSVYEFAKFIKENRINMSYLNLKAVIITGEMIFNWQKNIIKEVFSCPVVNEYGCTEVGIIAFECPMGGMHIMSDNLFVEVIPGNDKDKNEGEILITELNNYYSPLIRYKLGDKIILSDSICPCGRGFSLISSIKGRSDNFILFPCGRKTDPFVFEYIIKKIPEKYGRIQQFEVIQEDIHSLRIRFVCDTIDEKELIKIINDLWEKMYGNTLQLKIEFVKSISRDTSGKLSCFKSFIQNDS